MIVTGHESWVRADWGGGVIMPTLVKTVIGTLAALLAISTDIQRARAQCAPNDKIYIDPRLVPQRPRVSDDEFGFTRANPWLNDQQKRATAEQYYSQFQPIQMPFRNGYVLISPTNPCIQQYIER